MARDPASPASRRLASGPIAPQRGRLDFYHGLLELGSGDQIPYAVHLPDGFDPSKTHPVLAGPGEAEKGEDAG